MNRNQEQNTKDLAAKNNREVKSAQSNLARQKQNLETVAETSHEMSLEFTDRIRKSPIIHQQNQKSKPLTPFMVEKYEYKIEYDEDDNKENRTPQIADSYDYFLSRGNIGKPVKRPVNLEIKIENASERQANASLATPSKTSNIEALVSPKNIENIGKSGFFSMRKKTLPNEGIAIQSTANNGKIKIVNNIFQNTFLQHVVNPNDKQDSSKKKVKEVKVDEKAHGAVKRKINMSMEVKDVKPHKAHHSVLLSSSRKTGKRMSHSRDFENLGLVTPTSKVQTMEDSLSNKLTFGMPTPSEASSTLGGKSQKKSLLKATVEVDAHEYDQMKKFHTKLGKLMKELGVEDEGSDSEMDYKKQWWFVREMANGYFEAKQKIRKLEEILKSGE